MIRQTTKIIILACLFLFSSIFTISNAQIKTIDINYFDDLRIEQEDKIFVPLNKADEVWEYLYRRYIENKEFVQSLDSSLTAYYNNEQFTDTYFDTPDLKLISMQSGVRLRKRINLTNPDDPKSGRELMQIKINNISDNELERGELKFDIEYPKEIKTRDDQHPMIGIVKFSDRSNFKEQLEKLGLEAYSMRPILTVHDLRRRIYFEKDDVPFMSISFDNVDVGIWWARAKFIEIEPELSEAEFTEANPEAKKYMEEKLNAVINDLKKQFPYLETNLNPKYNKSFDYLKSQLPFLPLLVKLNLHNSQGFLLALIIFWSIIAGSIYLLIRQIRKILIKKD
ncbi:MAG: CYTH domain-containing protein [Patescibacteria group bacterium]|nr:CYTH domain-containing protein [Patescibacteria group bacterium]